MPFRLPVECDRRVVGGTNIVTRALALCAVTTAVCLLELQSSDSFHDTAISQLTRFNGLPNKTTACNAMHAMTWLVLHNSMSQ